jgi:predicted ABC-type ATPase
MRAKRADAPCIYVLAGPNGGGKSSIGGAMLRQKGVECFNPDAAARRIRAANRGVAQDQANSLAWHQGKRLLERAIDEQGSFAFETTLGGRTMTALLDRALASEVEVRMWYVALSTADLHVARVRARVARGGHAIPDATIRDRYNSSRLNLIHLLPKLTELRLFDNSDEADPAAGVPPEPRLILHMAEGSIVKICDLAMVPGWAKPIVAIAMRPLARG